MTDVGVLVEQGGMMGWNVARLGVWPGGVAGILWSLLRQASPWYKTDAPATEHAEEAACSLGYICLWLAFNMYRAICYYV